MRLRHLFPAAALAAVSMSVLLACGGDKPPVPTPEEFTEISEVELGGYTRESGSATDTSATATYLSQGMTDGGAQIQMTLDFTSCKAIDCPSVKPSDYEEEEAVQEVRDASLPEFALNDPELFFQLGQIDVASGRQGMFHRAVSFVDDASGEPERFVQYVAWYHNGSLLVTITLVPVGEAVDETESLVELNEVFTLAEAFVTGGTAFARYRDYFGD
jgi:hypothetical protein